MIIDETIRVMRPSRGSLVYILKTKQGLVIVDTGSEIKAAPIVVDYVKNRLHQTPDQIRYIFLTHWHGDHSGAAERLRELTEPNVCHQGDSSLLAGNAGIDYCWDKLRVGLNPFMQLVCSRYE